jgi:hypothetical protein
MNLVFCYAKRVPVVWAHIGRCFPYNQSPIVDGRGFEYPARRVSLIAEQQRYTEARAGSLRPLSIRPQSIHEANITPVARPLGVIILPLCRDRRAATGDHAT